MPSSTPSFTERAQAAARRARRIRLALTLTALSLVLAGCWLIAVPAWVPLTIAADRVHIALWLLFLGVVVLLFRAALKD